MEYQPSLLHRPIKHKAAGTMNSTGGGAAYQGAGRSRYLKQFLPSWFGPNQELKYDLDSLRLRSRDLYKNNDVTKGIIDTLTTNVIGVGLRLHCKIDRKTLGLMEMEAENLEDEIEHRWRLWADSYESDIARGMTFGQIQALAFSSALKDGEVLAVLPDVERPGSDFKLRVQLIEADFLQSPAGKFDDKVQLGIEVDKNGAPEKYYFTEVTKWGTVKSFKSVDAFGKLSGRQNVVHLFKKDRPGQLRGIPIISSIIQKLKNLDRYDEAELIAALVSSYYTGFVESADKNAKISPLNELSGANADGSTDYVMGPGAIQFMDPGEKITFNNPTRPNSNFTEFIDTQLRSIGMALGIPFEILVQMFNSSYSASRASRVEFFKRITVYRDFTSKGFIQPIYEEWLSEEILQGNILAPGFFTSPTAKRAYVQASWVGDPMGSIDELKDVNAAAKRMEVKLTTLAEETLKHTGEDWKNNIDKKKFEKEYIGEDEIISTGTENSRQAVQRI